ncbi:hypothetical protein PsorP6_009074 [Peronosclerospora sorghi]|uniref:Uncharacterized protein n=1 Tax=Peronosclerospora sorghi TaxID=230839 RepID=A0ACC0VXL1_9STRA|nr:hypothetical protein PsorP6_009074 [Peronosclerospora sorghi]
MLTQYEPLETLAPALFGNVEKWRYLPTNECVAVKRMELRYAARKRSKSAECAVEEDLLTEIKINLRIQSLGGHSNVLPLRDCIMDDKAVLLVLKFCPQGELLDVINNKRAAGHPIDTLHYFAQILRGAAFLHANDIAHRDLSLENVLVDEFDRCYITDFGLSTQCQGKLDVKPVGKLRYTAPEVSGAMMYQGEQLNEYDPKMADVWALGVMLYAMVAGRYPFREPLRTDNRFKLLEDFGVDYLLEKDDVELRGEKVKNLLRKLLVVDPSKRSTLAELESYLALHGVDTKSESVVAQEQSVKLVQQAPIPTSQDTRQRVRSLGRFSKGSLASVRPITPVIEARKANKRLPSTNQQV